MSAAILLPTGLEKTNSLSVSSDLLANQIEPGMVCFAEKFNERVGEPHVLKGNISEAAIPSMKVPGEEPPKRSDTATAATAPVVLLSGTQVGVAPSCSADTDTVVGSRRTPVVPKTPHGPKAHVSPKPFGDREILANGDLQSLRTSGIGSLQTVVAQTTRGEVQSDSSPMKEALPSVPEKVPEEVRIALRKPETEVARDESLSLIVVARADLSPLLVGEAPAVKNQVSDGKKILEVSTAKVAKRQTAAAEDKSVQKQIGSAGAGSESHAKTAVGTAPVWAFMDSPIPGTVRGTTIVPIGEAANEVAEGSETISRATKTRIVTVALAAEEPADYGSGHQVRVDAMQDGMSAIAAVDQGTIDELREAEEKIGAVAPTGVHATESKTQGAGDVTTTAAHVMSEGAQASLEIASAVVAPRLAGDLSSAKQKVSDESVSTALVAESSEQSKSSGAVTATGGMPQMLTATPTSLEVGIANGTHGWLKVRAELVEGGGIHASVLTASSLGQETLHREIPSLTAYLQQENIAVNSVAIHAATPELYERAGSNAGMGGGGQTRQGSDDKERPQSSSPMTAGRDGEAISYPEDDANGLLPLAIPSGGGWLSVRA